MYILLKMLNNFFKKNYFLLPLIFCFSITFNGHYASLGVFPIDTFYHYDTGFRVMNNEFPVKDYWVTTGILVDFIEALFFKVFGVSWFSHILHSSIFNALIIVFTFHTFKIFNLNIFYSFCYSLLFGVLAYPPSGTPFVDHHAILFLLAGGYSLLLGIKTEKNIYWLILPWFFGFSFLCKQVPAAYMIILTSIFFLIYFIIKKNLSFLINIFISSFFFIISIVVVIFYLEISYKDFITQYILYPPSIGADRILNFKLNLNDFFNHYKFILIPFLLIIFFNYKKIISSQITNNNLFIFGAVLIFLISSIYHQILTKNQIFIYFLSPLIFAYLTISTSYKKYKNYIMVLILIFSTLITAKYHYRFNEQRKFHELQSVDLSKGLNAKLIDNQLKGLNWITPTHKSDPKKEIEIILNWLNTLKEDERPKMVITHYLFINSIMKQSLNLPSRSFTLDGASFPIKGNKYFENYKNFFNRKIKEKKIEVIYILENKIQNEAVTNYLEKKCLKSFKQEKYLRTYELNIACFN
jgi:hypothetical protein